MNQDNLGEVSLDEEEPVGEVEEEPADDVNKPF
jgi:hypothetical protein